MQIVFLNNTFFYFRGQRTCRGGGEEEEDGGGGEVSDSSFWRDSSCLWVPGETVTVLSSTWGDIFWRWIQLKHYSTSCDYEPDLWLKQSVNQKMSQSVIVKDARPSFISFMSQQMEIKYQDSWVGTKEHIPSPETRRPDLKLTDFCFLCRPRCFIPNWIRSSIWSSVLPRLRLDSRLAFQRRSTRWSFLTSVSTRDSNTDDKEAL